MQKNKIHVDFEIEADQKVWLEQMADEFNLPDTSKALRALIDYALQDGDKEQIFGEIRCLRCG